MHALIKAVGRIVSEETSNVIKSSLIFGTFSRIGRADFNSLLQPWHSAQLRLPEASLTRGAAKFHNNKKTYLHLSSWLLCYSSTSK